MWRSDNDAQPDSGGNRHYDYISVERHDAAEERLKNIDLTWSELESDDIVCLRSKARDLHILKDIVDIEDRLALLHCLFSHCENRNDWIKRESVLQDQLAKTNKLLLEHNISPLHEQVDKNGSINE